MSLSRGTSVPAIVALALVALLSPLLAVLSGAAPAASGDEPAGQLVKDVAASKTPHVLDGRVYSVVQVGNLIILGGTFTRVRNDGETAELARHGLVAFDAQTGRISPTFDPGRDGAVRVVLPSGDGTSVYVGGSFTRIGAVARAKVARVRVSDGAVVGSFAPGAVNGEVKDLALRSGRLWLAGAFTHVGGVARRALATVDPTTGAVTPFMSLAVAGVHRGTVTQVLKMDITPDGSRLVAVGNFDTLAGVSNHQLLVLDLTGSRAAPSGLRTSFYTAPCSASFETYLRDVDIAPDGTWFVVGTTGAYGGAGSPCDSVARFELGAVGADVAPSWIDNTGGDTTHSVEVSNGVVYAGGHQRWWNNPFAGDRAGAGAVSREGIAALDPINGLPFTWNPGRTKGVGVFDFLSTSQGLWVASDTDRIGNYQLKSRIARFNAGGIELPAVRTPSLPGDVYLGGALAATAPGGLWKRAVSDGAVGPRAAAPAGGPDWGATRGAFMVNGSLYVAHADGSFTRRSFDGSTFGAAEPVAAADQIVPLTAWHDDLRAATGLFFDQGRIYYTLAGSRSLYYRYFTPQSGVVGAQRLVASGSVAGLDLDQVRGMFVTPTHLYWGQADGGLRRAAWTRTGPSGLPVAGTAELVSTGADGLGWAARSLFVFQGSGAPSATLSHVATTAAGANVASPRIAVPAGVAAGDRLLLHLTLNDHTVRPTGPAGWELVDTVDGAGVLGRSWTKVATAADAGSTVTVPTTGVAKSVLTMSAYRSSGGSTTINAHGVAVDGASGTSHVAPSLTVAAPSWVVISWVAKSSADTVLAAGAGVTTRATTAGAGGGRLTALVGDSGGPRAPGVVGGATVTSTPAVSRTVMFTTAISVG